MERPPPSLKKVVPYLNLGKQYSQKDPIVSYYCELLYMRAKLWALFRKFGFSCCSVLSGSERMYAGD